MRLPFRRQWCGMGGTIGHMVLWWPAVAPTNRPGLHTLTCRELAQSSSGACCWTADPHGATCEDGATEPPFRPVGTSSAVAATFTHAHTPSPWSQASTCLRVSPIRGVSQDTERLVSSATTPPPHASGSTPLIPLFPPPALAPAPPPRPPSHRLLAGTLSCPFLSLMATVSQTPAGPVAAAATAAAAVAGCSASSGPPPSHGHNRGPRRRNRSGRPRCLRSCKQWPACRTCAGGTCRPCRRRLTKISRSWLGQILRRGRSRSRWRRHRRGAVPEERPGGHWGGCGARGQRRRCCARRRGCRRGIRAALRGWRRRCGAAWSTRCL